MNKITPILIILFLFCSILGVNGIVSDYSDVESFEMDLNEGEDVSGKIVTFVVNKFVPNSVFGYNLQAGEHLNFCSLDHPGKIEVGDKLTVRVTSVKSFLGSFIIYYEKVK